MDRQDAVTGKPEGWSEKIIEVWDCVIRVQTADEEENELEYPVRSIFEDSYSTVLLPKTPFQGRLGTLHATESGFILKKLQEMHLPFGCPKTPAGLARRLRDGKFKSFRVLDEKNAPDISALKRTSSKRPIGIFFPDDDAVTKDDGK